MPVSKVFQSGNSQAVRIPRDLQFRTDEVEIIPQEDGLFVRPARPGLSRAFELLCELSDAFDERPDDPPPQVRDVV